MTDEELIETLWKGEVTLSVVVSTAVRIQELVKERDTWQKEALRQNALLNDALSRAEVAEARIEELVKEQARLNAGWHEANGRALNAGLKLAKAGIVALETILDERGPVFDAMVDAAEDAAGKDVSFNVVVGRAIRAALAELEKTDDPTD